MLRISCLQAFSKNPSSVALGGIGRQTRGINTGLRVKDPLQQKQRIYDKRIGRPGLGDVITRKTTEHEREIVRQTGSIMKPQILPSKETFQMRNNAPEELLVERRGKGLYESEFDPHNTRTPNRTSGQLKKLRLAPLDMNLPIVRTRNVSIHTLPNGEQIEMAFAIGSRKTSSATVMLYPGSGLVTVNDKSMAHYFSRMTSREMILEPLLLTHNLGKFDIVAKVTGGGLSGQAGAIQLATARALQDWEPMNRPVLKQARLLMRDPRKVERKKPGQAKARKKFQWVKR